MAEGNKDSGDAPPPRNAASLPQKAGTDSLITTCLALGSLVFLFVFHSYINAEPDLRMVHAPEESIINTVRHANIYTRTGTCPIDVSIIVPLKNNEGRDLLMLISSVKDEIVRTRACAELIFVDDYSDASNMSLGSIVKELFEETAHSLTLGIVFTARELGVSGARNEGANASTGECLMFLNVHDILLPGALSVIKNDIKSRGSGYARFQATIEPQIHPDWVADLNSKIVQTLVVPRSLHDLVGGFSTAETFRLSREFEDFDYSMALNVFAAPLDIHAKLVRVAFSPGTPMYDRLSILQQAPTASGMTVQGSLQERNLFKGLCASVTRVAGLVRKSREGGWQDLTEFEGRPLPALRPLSAGGASVGKGTQVEQMLKICSRVWQGSYRDFTRPANKCYGSVLHVEPQNTEAWLSLGDASSAGEEFDTAVLAFNAAVSLAPADGISHLSYGVSIMNACAGRECSAQEYITSHKHVKMARELAPSNANVIQLSESLLTGVYANAPADVYVQISRY